jgi:hypothetical protein
VRGRDDTLEIERGDVVGVFEHLGELRGELVEFSLAQ